MTTIIQPFLGPKPADFDETQTKSELAVNIACCIVVFLTLVCRTLGRYALKLRNDAEYDGGGKFLGLDDVLNFIAVLLFYGFSVSVFIAINRGMGVHITRVLWLGGTDGLSSYLGAIYATAILYNATLGFIKLSVLALYRRILRGISNPRLNIINWIIIGLVAANTMANVLVAAFQCTPISAAWDQSITKKKCTNDSAFYIGNAITGIITDSMVYLMAIPIVRPLQMDQQRKFNILFTFLVGIFAIATSAIRMSFLPKLLATADPVYQVSLPMDWSLVEIMVGILVSSMPAIRSMVHLFKPRFNARTQNISSLKSNIDRTANGGHIKLHDYNGGFNNSTNISTRKMDDDNDSEKNLIYQGTKTIGITKTTDIEVSHV